MVPSVPTDQNCITNDVLTEYLCYLYGTLLVSKSLLAEYIYDTFSKKFEIFDQQGNQIRSSCQLIDFFSNSLDIHPWFESSQPQIITRFYNRISLLLLRYFLSSKSVTHIFFCGIKPWFTDLAEKLDSKRIASCNLLYIHKPRFFRDTLRFLFQVCGLIKCNKTIYLWRDSSHDIFEHVVSFIQNSRYHKYISPKEIVGLASLVASTLHVTRSIPTIKNRSLNGKEIFLAEAFSPLSFSVLLRYRSLCSVYSHGSISSFVSSFTNEHLFNTLTGYPISNSFNAQTLASSNYASSNKLNYQQVSTIAIKLPYDPNSQCSQNKSVFLFASTYKPLNNLRFGLFPFSTQYLSDLLLLARSLSNLPNSQLIISHRDLGELTIQALRKALEQCNIPLDNIIISNKAFEENAAKSSVLVSHTSTTIEQWLPTKKPVVLFKVKGISSPYLDTTETLESDLYIVDNQDDNLPSILETISKKLVQI